MIDIESINTQDRNRNIIIFTGDDMFYAPLLLKKLILNRKSEIKHIYISKSYISYKRLSKKLKFFLINKYPFCISISDWIRFIYLHLSLHIKGKFRNQPTNIKDYFTKLGLESSYIEDLNDPELTNDLKSKSPDLFIFALFDKIANEGFCSIPKFGTYNVHMGKLPSYKGGLSSFWLLRFNDKVAGSSIHKVTKLIDSGALVSEIRFPVRTNSMHDLMLETMHKSSEMLVKTISQILASAEKEINIKGRENNYYLYPSKEDFKKFYKKGYRLI